jgi:hypothetical protein
LRSLAFSQFEGKAEREGSMVKFLSPASAGAKLGFSQWTLLQYCHAFPGFAFRLRPGGHWKIHEAHVARLMVGEPVSSIAARPSAECDLPERIFARARNRRRRLIEVADAGP